MEYKKLVHIVNLLFLLGAGLLSWFLILSGAREGGTLRKFYWFQAETTGFNDAPDSTRWYNYNWCGWDNGVANSYHCSSRRPAEPFSPRDNFGSNDIMPSTFLNNRDTYYYLSRVAWAMLLIGLFFIMLVIIPQIVNIFFSSRMIGFSAIAVAFSWAALFFILLAACLYTGCYEKARRAFKHDGRFARLGKNNFAFIWTTVFLLLVSSIWTTIDTAHVGYRYAKDGFSNNANNDTNNYDNAYYNSYPRAENDNNVVNDRTSSDSEPNEHTSPAQQPTFFTKMRTKKHVKKANASEPDEQQESQEITTVEHGPQGVVTDV
ncbi:hypothetical protein KAFR_0A07670 [Kazachstania africana CBS 2517]|uniref:Uncharacterized protein n=1 Tax=Kazachstania africana (strain ATCC 22294 / BCRC 22015 / CBS 2517 / CECT 1963 / NBRC 1671 / NRRL Y-8276) TaxID=1071382 RepID=H2APA1_KAZAF|nr:hypothetical protein KAFR_0A07670 [Kazachstania africana CBS 2517]CCF56201.1 hypothetical protein KAFR_0A07670 [Kazachstania africana CBS 2517]